MQIDDATTLPTDNLVERELDMLLLKLGSFLSIVLNKKVNQAKLLIHIIENRYFCDLALAFTGIDNKQLLIKSILERYPTVCKSKLVLNVVTRNAKQTRAV